MQFHSILFDRRENNIDVDEPEAPECFGDLHLDQVLESMTAGYAEYNLKPFFYTALREVAAVQYRHDVLRDLQKKPVFETIESFAANMRAMRKHLVQGEKLHDQYQKERWFLEAVAMYSDAVNRLAKVLTALDLNSRGLTAFRVYLTDYTKSSVFTSLGTETQQLQDDLSRVKYSVHIKGNRVKVSNYEEEADYSAEVERTFAKFQQGIVKDYRVKLPEWPEMNHVEAHILDLVARLYPDVFRALDEYYARHHDYLDPVICSFDREVQFYVAYLEYMERFTAAGLNFCYPQVSTQSKEVHAHDAFDLALADKRVSEGATVVCNEFSLQHPERIMVVTGPNQGGKTTFARMFGQLHYLAGLGYPVPGREAMLFLPDRIFTHFEKEEDLATLSGKLEEELVRIHGILRHTTSDSILIMNESFSSTTLNDALFLGGEVMKRLIELDLLCVYVTFIDELTTLSASTVSMVSAVVPDNPAIRTYKIERRPADGLAYAAAIAQKYGLTYERLKGRIAP